MIGYNLYDIIYGAAPAYIGAATEIPNKGGSKNGRVHSGSAAFSGSDI